MEGPLPNVILQQALFLCPSRASLPSVEHSDQRRSSNACAGFVRCIWLLCGARSGRHLPVRWLRPHDAHTRHRKTLGASEEDVHTLCMRPKRTSTRYAWRAILSCSVVHDSIGVCLAEASNPIVRFEDGVETVPEPLTSRSSPAVVGLLF